MSDSPDSARDIHAWYLKDDTEEIGPLNEQELRHQLSNESDRLTALRVRQGNSDWYPAQAVLDKFQLLTKEGIYVRHDGVADGPFTAAKTIQLLANVDRERIDAKVGISGSWIPAEQLYLRLLMVARAADGTTVQVDRDADDDSDSDVLDSNVFGSDVWDGNDDDEPIIMAQPVREKESSFEVILLADPVASVSRPLASAGIATAPGPPLPPVQSAHQAPVGRPDGSVPPKYDSTVIWVTAILLVLLLIMLVGGIAIFYRPSTPVWLQSAAPGPSPRAQADGDEAVPFPPKESMKNAEDVPAPVDGPPPVVERGMLFQPKFLTSIGEASGGTMFAGRVGRSNRILLIGAAHLLGPATGLARQLRGAEALMHWQGLEITDCVNDFRRPVRGEPLRLHTAEFPTKSANGDSLAIQPEVIRGLEPLPITSELPNPGDRVWLLAPIRDSDKLVHSGRFVGTDDGWLVYRLDDQALDMIGTSGGAVVNVKHEAFAIHVAGGASTDGVLSIASPLSLIVQEIQ